MDVDQRLRKSEIEASEQTVKDDDGKSHQLKFVWNMQKPQK